MTIGFVPLDTRPCTYDFPIQLALQKGAQVLVPPVQHLGFYKEASDTAAVAHWLEEIAPRCDALVISAEQLLYGGLIQSRQSKLSEHDITATLDVLRRIRCQNPALPVYIFNILMRTSISILDAASAVWWEKINQYSIWAYRAQTGNDSRAKEQCLALKSEIPEKVLQCFLEARKRNHVANLACLQLVRDGIADRLFLLQEDCAPEGLQRFEQEKLLCEVQKNHLGDRVFLFNGTDEAGSELIQHALCPKGCPIDIVWLAQQTDFTANYEDRPFKENLSGHMAALSMQLVSGSDRVLCILPPKRKQREASEPCIDPATDYTAEELQHICETIWKLVRQGRSCYLLDLDFSNGGNAELLNCLAHVMSVRMLRGYSAWNTASNSLGTLLAQILADDGGDDAMNQRFTAERILDDCLYQSIVRQIVTKSVQKAGMDCHNITDVATVEQWLQDAFRSIQPLMESIFDGDIPEFSARLRWPRLFEAAVFTRHGVGPVFGK